MAVVIAASIGFAAGFAAHLLVSALKGRKPEVVSGESPLERAIGRGAVEAYEEALEELNEDQKAAVILRIELGCKHREVAELLGSPSANAARMLVSRAILRLSEVLNERSLRDGG